MHLALVNSSRHRSRPSGSRRTRPPECIQETDLTREKIGGPRKPVNRWTWQPINRFNIRTPIINASAEYTYVMACHLLSSLHETKSFRRVSFSRKPKKHAKYVFCQDMVNRNEKARTRKKNVQPRTGLCGPLPRAANAPARLARCARNSPAFSHSSCTNTPCAKHRECRRIIKLYNKSSEPKRQQHPTVGVRPLAPWNDFGWLPAELYSATNKTHTKQTWNRPVQSLVITTHSINHSINQSFERSTK